VIALWRGQQTGHAAMPPSGGNAAAAQARRDRARDAARLRRIGPVPGRVVLSSSLLVTPPGGAGHIESGADGAGWEKP